MEIFSCGEEACIWVLKKLNQLIDDNRERSYTTVWSEDMLLGNKLERTQWSSEVLDCYPFQELWEAFYEKEIKTPALLIETVFYLECCEQRKDYEQNRKLYQKVFNHTFSKLGIVLTYASQVQTVLSVLFEQYVPQELLTHYGMCGIAKLLTILDASNEKLLDGKTYQNKKRVLELPIFTDMCNWLSDVRKEDWEVSFVLRFRMQQYFWSYKTPEVQPKYWYHGIWKEYMKLSDYVQCYVRGIWDKDLFYKAVFTFYGLDVILRPISIVELKGAVFLHNMGEYGLNAFFGWDMLQPVDGKYHFDTIGDEMPEMVFAHELYKEIVPMILKVELKRGEQPTPFSKGIQNIGVIYGIDYM
ncbi:MAG: DUF4132 domain-containing protein, partial [Lachnospiraceae bacterium]|nr:DUF4132 domain-containing protein [Lachnospiraceae bacterium]